ncbi:hypothetical protein [Streptomyces sp. NPDC056194]|uniref:hypothetical protein n=1 Tax=unclassified Streptomyces TaxID=2593676 RepID=UPI0035DD359D
MNGPASNPAAPADVLPRLLALDDDWIARRPSRRAALPDSVAEAMLHHPRRRVRTALADSATATPELRARLLDGPASDAMAVAVGPIAHRTPVPPLPDRAYERLLNHERGMVRYETVQSAGIPAHAPVPLAGHEDPLFPVAACRRVWSELTDEVRTALLGDADPAVRTMASLQVTHEDEERTAELVEALADDRRLGDASEPEARRPTLRDPGATPALVERLSRDPAVRVREAAALDRRLPVARLLELLEDPKVGRAAARSPLPPVPEMRALLDRSGIPGL